MVRSPHNYFADYPDGDPGAVTCRACGTGKTRHAGVLVCRVCDLDPTYSPDQQPPHTTTEGG